MYLCISCKPKLIFTGLRIICLIFCLARILFNLDILKPEEKIRFCLNDDHNPVWIEDPDIRYRFLRKIGNRYETYFGKIISGPLLQKMIWPNHEKRVDEVKA